MAVALAQRLLREIGVAEEVVTQEAARIPDEISLRSGFTLVVPRGDTRTRENYEPQEASEHTSANTTPPEVPSDRPDPE